MFLSTQYHPLLENGNDATDFITEDFSSLKVLIFFFCGAVIQRGSWPPHS